MKHIDCRPDGGYLRGMHINWGVGFLSGGGVTVWGVIFGGYFLCTVIVLLYVSSL